MHEIIEIIKQLIIELGPFVGFLVIIIESIFPILPLGLFISLNMLAFGNMIGYIISLIATIAGCLLSFYAFKKGFNNILYKHIKLDGKIDLFLKRIGKIKFRNLVLLISMPFTPSFAVNISAGLSKMEDKKFILAILIGKPFMVFFWGFVGKTIIESINDPLIISIILMILLLSYLLSELVQKILNIKE